MFRVVAPVSLIPTNRRAPLKSLTRVFLSSSSIRKKFPLSPCFKCKIRKQLLGARSRVDACPLDIQCTLCWSASIVVTDLGHLVSEFLMLILYTVVCSRRGYSSSRSIIIIFVLLTVKILITI